MLLLLEFGPCDKEHIVEWFHLPFLVQLQKDVPFDLGQSVNELLRIRVGNNLKSMAL